MRRRATKPGRRPDIVCVEGPRAVNRIPLCGLAGVLTTIDAESRPLPVWRPRCVYRQAGRDQNQRERPTWLEQHARLHDLLCQDRCCPLRVTGPQMVKASFSDNLPRVLRTRSNAKRSRFAGDGRQLVPILSMIVGRRYGDACCRAVTGKAKSARGGSSPPMGQPRRLRCVRVGDRGG